MQPKGGLGAVEDFLHGFLAGQAVLDGALVGGGGVALEDFFPGVGGLAGLVRALLEKLLGFLDGGCAEAWKKVLKSYPTTTHQRTIEYRLPSKEAVQKIFDSAEAAFRLQKNTVFKGE